METIKRAVALGFFDGVHRGHAALLEQVKNRASEKNALPTVLTFDVHPELAEDPDRWTLPLSKMGYSLEPFGETTFIVREIPGFTTLGEAEEFIKAYTEAFLDGIQLDDRVVIDKLITKSCKSAIKAHDYIKPEEAEALLKDLKQCRNPFSCPHGRPVFIRFTVREIERMFKRIV